MSGMETWLTGLSTAQFLALVTLLAVGAFTPGPNTTVAAVTGANFGLRATLPHCFGVSVGFASIIALCATGVGALILASPTLATLIRVAGVLYLLWLAWRIARSSSLAGKTSGHRGKNGGDDDGPPVYCLLHRYRSLRSLVFHSRDRASSWCQNVPMTILNVS